MAPDGKAMIADVVRTLEYALGRILDAKLPRLKPITGYRRKLILIWTDWQLQHDWNSASEWELRHVSGHD